MFSIYHQHFVFPLCLHLFYCRQINFEVYKFTLQKSMQSKRERERDRERERQTDTERERDGERETLIC